MATTDTGEPTETDAASDLARTLRTASFVHLVTARDGDCVAAAGIVGRALETRGTPFQVSVVDTPAEADRRITAGDATTTAVGVGVSADAADAAVTGVPRSAITYDAATDLAPSTPGVASVAAAGGIAAGGDLTTVADAREALRSEDADRVPGVAVPTTDLAAGLTHSTLVHAPFSGDEDAAEDFLAGVATEAPIGGRDLASAVALAVAGPEDTPDRAGIAVERFLRPMVTDDAFASVGGYGDVLAASARTNPGAALAVALGRGGADAALAAWRDHGRRVQDAVTTAELRRHAGLVVCETTAPTAATARLLRDFRAPEPNVLVVGDGAASLATGEADAAATLAGATDSSTVQGRPRLASTTTTEGDLVAAVREVL
ncbi:MAG: recombinase RecJ [Halobacteriaceae archaeon]